ncbi:transmembrane protein 41B [Trichonephila inaurata madagascariensis]|uniref:Transmembrane protein 41B n=1 Tax=Trichonephila inaurata madagascariensis TaxID=2747483 RepID=A0A8X6YHA1_9ARAC|nr:transmembrane protein 41B [Trichonephila inaurata madagascariensis]
MELQNSYTANNIDHSTEKKSPQSTQSTSKAIFILVGIFILSVSGLLYLYSCFPDLEENEAQYMKLPLDIEDAKNLGKVLAHYKERYYFTVLFAYFLTYIFLQSFAIPGSIFLSILSGFLYPFPLAIFLVCTVNKHKDHLLNYIIFLRITPFLPNWFINITSPVIGVPAYPFIMGTFLGVAPPSFVMIQAGKTLHELTSSTDAYSWFSVLMLCLLAVISLLPILFKRKLQEKLE